LKDLHPWGGPVYVLNKRLHDGNHPSSKWDPQAWLGVYIGHSTIHSGNVVLVYNLVTGHTTPQFHVVFDDYFQMVNPNFSSLPSETVTNLFETLWTKSQWAYDGDILQEYLFHKNHDFPDMTETDTAADISFPDGQLATDTLEAIDYYVNGISPQEPTLWTGPSSIMENHSASSDQSNTSGAWNHLPDQRNTSGILDPHPDQRNTSGITAILPDQSTTSGTHKHNLDSGNTMGLQPTSPDQCTTSGYHASPPDPTNTSGTQPTTSDLHDIPLLITLSQLLQLSDVMDNNVAL